MEAPLDNEAICTYSHIAFKPMEPDVANVSIEDIAHALSNTCRYSGHVPKFYSVAEHSVRMVQKMRKVYEPYTHLDGVDITDELLLRALLHDSSEAYLTDIPKPIKHLIDGYKEAEDRLLGVIGDAVGLTNLADLPYEVRYMDMYMLCWELRDFFEGPQDWYSTQTKEFYYNVENQLPRERIKCWSPAKAERKFLDLFDDLYPSVFNGQAN